MGYSMPRVSQSFVRSGSLAITFSLLSLLRHAMIRPQYSRVRVKPHVPQHERIEMRDNRHLLDELEISKLPVTYAWAMDSKDIELLMSVFAEGVEYDVSSLGFPPIVGKEAVRQFYLTQVFPREEASFSSISNIRIELRGDTAIGGDYFMHYGYHSTGSASPTITFGQPLY